MTWQVRSSNKMLILGIVFFIAGFVLMTIFFKLVPFSPSDRPIIWLWTVLAMLTFGLGLFSIIAVKTKDALATLLVLLVWSFVFLIPVPEGYEDYVWGGSLVFLCVTTMLYVKYKEFKKKKAQLGKETGK
ncbi:hypothetical protein KAU55_01160 [Candidatus Bathyarchaeota archaeon]|nr:hypothetical protein [Candidatus Bathyarchaeota archaeon]